MNKRDFLYLYQPEKYDFTEENASDTYKVLNGLDRFFAYMIDDKGKDCAYEEVIKIRKQLDELNVFEGLVDPDSNCELLCDIYKTLWDKNYLEYWNPRKNLICGETMNSANTTLDKFASLNKSKYDELSNQEMTIRYLIKRFYDEDGKLKSFLEKEEHLKKFIETYHTLGNFIPFPKGCNSPRGCGTTKDYWDLTLKHIYDYYPNKDKNAIQNIYKNSEIINNFIDWLEKFGDWETFVKKNYLMPFVNINDNGSYAKPKELWEGHFSGAILPGTTEQCNAYFKNASEWILARGKLIVEELKKEVNKKANESSEA